MHTSMNPEPSLTALGLSLEGQSDDTYDSANTIHSISTALDELMNEKHRRAGTIARTSHEYLSGELECAAQEVTTSSSV
ncbi:hypothetical protein GYMLUDRAFT_251596 [Collybiopsis luxurians FD-317 M1]|uniref:Uncharacterized protein n=1 Tax=Collybiopsis luxurians FD-317 M1 TaxID=944289 RepID=A0A0D0BCA1_9AGAR|nr:hypothetical protein GYMLUDRAFT_251596 [Collybiopsis luxurians FD-317 M1]